MSNSRIDNPQIVAASLNGLLGDLQLMMFGNFNIYDLRSVIRTDKRLYHIATSNVIWKKKFRLHFPDQVALAEMEQKQMKNEADYNWYRAFTRYYKHLYHNGDQPYHSSNEGPDYEHKYPRSILKKWINLIKDGDLDAALKAGMTIDDFFLCTDLLTLAAKNNHQHILDFVFNNTVQTLSDANKKLALFIMCHQPWSDYEAQLHEISSWNNSTLINIAIHYNNLRVLEYALTKNLNNHTLNQELFMSCYYNNSNATKMILENLPTKNYGQLMSSVSGRHCKDSRPIIKLLLDSGMNINMEYNGETLLTSVIKSCWSIKDNSSISLNLAVENLKLLLSYGARIDLPPNFPAPFFARDLRIRQLLYDDYFKDVSPGNIIEKLNRLWNPVKWRDYDQMKPHRDALSLYLRELCLKMNDKELALELLKFARAHPIFEHQQLTGTVIGVLFRVRSESQKLFDNAIDTLHQQREVEKKSQQP